MELTGCGCGEVRYSYAGGTTDGRYEVVVGVW